MTAARVSQLLAEIPITADALFVSQFLAEALNQSPTARASQFLAEPTIQESTARAAQFFANPLALGPGLLASQFLIEVLTVDLEIGMPPIYPTLIGLGFSVIARPIFYNARAVSGSGWQVGVGYADQPTWEFDLTYDVLADATSSSDLKKLLGFFLGMRGDLIRFLFLNPDDNSVTAQAVGTTDGTTYIYTLQRTYGSGQVGIENIGYVNLSRPFNVYLDHVLQDPGTYDVLTTIPVQQQLRFHSVPTAGQAITVDMSYYYYVHFKDPSNDFEKFADKLWTLKKVTLESLRG